MTRSPHTPAAPNGRRREVAALLAAARAVAASRAFAEASRAVSRACSAMLAADGGFVTVTAAGSPARATDQEVVCIEPAGLAIEANRLPAALRRLGARAVKLGKAVCATDLAASSKKAKAGPTNALVAPILIDGAVAGLLGALDKRDGFSAADSDLIEVFAEMAAVAMVNSRTLNGHEKARHALEEEVQQSATQLTEAEAKFEILVDNLPDVVARFDPELRHLYVSAAIERVTGRPARDYLGKTNRELGSPPELTALWDAALRRVFATGEAEVVEFDVSTAEGVRHFECRLVPERDGGGAVPSVLSVARDVTDRWLAHAAEQRARETAEALREATMVLTRSLDRETILVTLLDRMRRMVPFDRASVMLREAPSRISVRAVFDGDRVLPLTPEARPELEASEHPIVQRILTTGTAVLIPDIRARPDWSLPTDRASETSWMGIPLFARGDVTGLFSLSKREPDYFNDEHLRLAETMSSQASVAVENAILFEQMQASTVRMQLLSRRLVEVQESERRHIARELHDEAGQALVSLRYGLRLLESELAEGLEVGGRVTELVERTDAVIDGLHRLAADLRPASLDHLGLEAALRQYVRSNGSKLELETRFKARGFGERRLPPTVETALYRVVQEAMTNVARHAQATRVDVLVELRDERVMVMIEDDGVGFEPESVRLGHRFGLLGLKERAEALDGTLTLESAPGAGTTVIVEVASADPNPDR